MIDNLVEEVISPTPYTQLLHACASEPKFYHHLCIHVFEDQRSVELATLLRGLIVTQVRPPSPFTLELKFLALLLQSPEAFLVSSVWLDLRLVLLWTIHWCSFLAVVCCKIADRHTCHRW